MDRSLMTHLRIAAVILWMAAVQPVLAQDTFSGKVVSLSDGDTMRILRDGKQVRVRLHGVDCPESRQAYGRAARLFTSKKVFDQKVTVRVIETDRYGRLVSVVTDPDGESLNAALVRNGYAWWYHQYAADEKELGELEIAARAGKYGLWADSNPTPPWTYPNGVR